MTITILCVTSVLAGSAWAQPDPQPGRGVNFYSIEREIALGNQVAANFGRGTRALAGPAALAYIDGIGQRLAAQTGGPPFRYTFALFADDPPAIDEVAAFPGGRLFVPASLLLSVQDEDELAGMLAHAIAHVASRDWTRQATRAELMDIALVPLVYTAGWTGYALREATALAIPASLARLWEKYELDADRLAAHTMAAAGYDPAALAWHIERGQTWARPTRAQRVETIRAVIAGLPAQTYGPHQGLEQAQEEVRRLVANPPPVPAK